MMKSTYKICQIFLLMCGVFGADEDEVKSVSVMEGDSVTLNPDPAKIQEFILILWRFGGSGSTIAQIDGKEISYPSHTEILRDRLQLAQTGSLTIRNMRMKHSGLYNLQIEHSKGAPDKQRFSVTVYESPSVFDAGKAERQLMSVMEGDPVTLHVPQIQGDELIVWRSGDEGKLIAKADIEAKSPPLYDETDERFRDGLKLDQTGSLTITNTRTTDSGLYTAKISSNKQTLYKRFIVTVSVPGLSGGAVAGIVIGVLLLAAAVAGVMYYLRPRTTNLPNQTLTVTDEESITLNPDPKIQRGDEIQWLFGDTPIAEIKGETREITTYKGPDERFINRFKLDETTGSLTITDIFTAHTGHYTLKIRRGRETLYTKFHVSLRERQITVMEGESVTLNPDKEILIEDEIQWLFRDEEQQTVIAGLENTEVTKYYGTDWRFRDGLVLNNETGSLTITNFTREYHGYYTLKIRRGTKTFCKRFLIYDIERIIVVTEGDSVTLKPATEIQTDDKIQWLFVDLQTVIAEFNRKTGEILTHDDVADGRFRDRLELNETTGSLTIKNTISEYSGVYKLLITSRSPGLDQKFTVIVKYKVEEILLKGEYSVTLKPDPEIQSKDQILWMFGDQDKLIAQMKGGTVEIYDDVNKRFRGRLKLNKMTGSLTITDIDAEHIGLFKLQIISSSGEILYKKFVVSITLRYVEGRKGQPVHLNTGLTEIQRDDEIQWLFGGENSLIAEIKGGTGETHDVPDERFRDRLELNEKTGDLIIKNSRAKHAGRYKLKIRSSEGKTNWTYTVNITNSTGKRVNESEIVEMEKDPLLNGEYPDEVNEEEGTSSL